MQILMLHTKRGSEDGFNPNLYKQDSTYDVADTLARAFIREGNAVESPSDFGSKLLTALNQSTKGILS